MHGFMNVVIQEMVVRNFGQETWEKLREISGLNKSGQFLTKCLYDDKITIDLVVKASQLMGVSVDAILETFGSFFYDYCVEIGYGDILSVLGSSVKDFLLNLDALHDHLQKAYPGMVAPSFRCEVDEDGAAILHYYTGRPVFAPVVVGLVKAVAKNVHNLEITVKTKMPNAACSHIQFIIREKEPRDRGFLSCASLTGLPSFYFESAEPELTKDALEDIFPFHILFDEQMRIVQRGKVLKRILPTMNEQDSLLDHFEMIRPVLDFDFYEIISRINMVFILKSKAMRKLRLKGGMIHDATHDTMLYLCTLSLGDAETLRECGLDLDDIPQHDPGRELLIMTQSYSTEYLLSQRLEMMVDELQTKQKELENEKRKTDKLMYSVLPAPVANQLRNKEHVSPKRYESVTIMFSGIVGFTKFCVDNSSMENLSKITDYLNTVFTVLDKHVEKHKDVYKIETTGDKYMIASGVPSLCLRHATILANVALDIMDDVKSIRDPQGLPVLLTIGIHSGDVVAGVIGSRMPRYCLFGNTVNLASRTESTGQPSRINVSETAHRNICRDRGGHSLSFTYRGPVAMKGKMEPMKVWLLDRSRETVGNLCSPSKTCALL